MLSLGPGSACDVCLEPFGAEEKAPCSIPCGHVFCANCLHHIARPTCPLCRKVFELRHTIKLHVDLDNIQPSSPRDRPPAPSDADERARHFQDRISHITKEGGTEAVTTQISAECRTFLRTVPKNMYLELRTSHNMFSYMCRLKRMYVDQGQIVNQLTNNVAELTQDVSRLQAEIDVLKPEKSRLENENDALASECNGLQEKLAETETKLLLVSQSVFFISVHQ
ncbi:hypothetical protein C8J57DRAFT_1067964 [Mycena rebaudengoi]|nr:hypothetical protein C8J57DRAFT_1067964 [Mycena rebaudengoi]